MSAATQNEDQTDREDEFILDRMKREALEAHQMVAESYPEKIPYDNSHPDIVLSKREWGGYFVVVRGTKIGWVRKDTDGDWRAYLRTGQVKALQVRSDPTLRRYAVHSLLWESRDVGRRGYLPKV